MKSRATAPSATDDGPRRERRKRESLQALALGSAPITGEPAILLAPGPTSAQLAIPVPIEEPALPTRMPAASVPAPTRKRTTASRRAVVIAPRPDGADDGPAFHEIEEAFFRAGAEPTLQRNEGDEYEVEPRLWQRIFARQKSAT